ncbi:putative ribosomal protein L5 eukaryotic/L18 archaeal [Helianthus annuus]|nr:putative ribosomal protein L5 eukaryotic/L18 archaeal [Helianthus annuus]
MNHVLSFYFNSWCLCGYVLLLSKPRSQDHTYYKRFQVKFKRRREGKTDYRARVRLINQDKNKYNTPKYRYVVRFTNKDITAQVISATIAGDIVLASAYAHELPNYGLKVGLTNYAAAYCTGLLLARRATGEDFSVEPAETRRPFRALLDVGLIRTTTGNRVFGSFGWFPHSEKRFAGFNKDGKSLDADVHRKYIYGGHVATYMNVGLVFYQSKFIIRFYPVERFKMYGFYLLQTLQEDEPEKYQSHFSEYIKAGVEPDTLEELYKKVHAAIRADPMPKKSDKPQPKEHKRYNLKKLTYDERKQKLIERLNA